MPVERNNVNPSPGTCLRHFPSRFVALGAAALLTLSASLCIATPAVAADSPSLYARLGGASVVDALAADLIDRVAQDPRTARSFRDSNLKRVKQQLAAQLCQITGGGCAYDGDPMREVHAGHDITDAEFYAMVEILQQLLQERRVALAEQNALLALLAPMKRDVVRVQPASAGATR
jgi:hemoglobin